METDMTIITIIKVSDAYFLFCLRFFHPVPSAMPRQTKGPAINYGVGVGSEDLTLQKGGPEKVLAMLKGGSKCFQPLKGRGGRNKFYPALSGAQKVSDPCFFHSVAPPPPTSEKRIFAGPFQYD